MLKKLHFSMRRMNFQATWRTDFGEWYRQLFWEMLQAYFYSATKEPMVKMCDVTLPMESLVKNYYAAVRTPLQKSASTRASAIQAPLVDFHPDRVAVAFSSGKDCVHLVLRLIEMGYKPENILCVYVENLNRSESYYEKKSAPKICKMLGVEYRIVSVTNSIKLNRTGHNIGLREQLVTVLALPYILEFGAHALYFGNKHEGDMSFRRSPGLWTTTPAAFSYLEQRLALSGLPLISIRIHPDWERVIDDISIARDMVERFRPVLDATSSCYTQLNFREQRHDALQRLMPNIPLYNGCGHCQKCCIVNAVIYFWDERALKAPAAERAALAAHIMRKSEGSLASNEDVKTIVGWLKSGPPAIPNPHLSIAQ